MNNDRKIFEEIQAFLSKPETDVAPRGLCVPVEESELHSLETDVIRQRLNEARARQHLLKQFSAEEIAHLQFVDEAVAVLNYRAKNLQEARPSQQHPLEDHEYHKKSDAELTYIGKDAHAAAEAMKSHNTTAENKYRDQASDAATVRYWRQKNGMPEWYKKKYGHTKTNESVELDELSNELLGKYKSAAGKAASAADASGDFKTGNKRFSGIMKATKKQFANDAKDVKTESEELEELSAKTLGSYVKKATVDVAQNSYNSGRKVHEPKEYHKSKQAAKSRIQGVMRAANKLSTRNENSEPVDRRLWAELTEQARVEFDAYPSIASAGWIAREYSAQGGEWMVEDTE